MEETWRAIYSRFALRRDPMSDQARTIMLVRRIKDLLNRERKKRVVEAGVAVYPLLASDPPLVKEE